MSARDQILSRIRKGLGRGELDPARRAELDRRLAEPPRGPVPERANLEPAAQVGLFVEMAEESAATVARVARREALPRAVADYLNDRGMPPALTLAPDPDLGSLPWAESGLTVASRTAENGDRAALSPAFAGIAETGTLMLLSGPESPTTLNFLPDAHLVVLAADRIVGPFEDAWDRLRRSRGDLPRTVNFITGPSRSGDIEQTLQMGAHGPVDLHILLVGDRSGDSARAATDGRDRDSS